MNDWLVAALVLAGLLTLLIAVSMIATAVERVGLAKHLGYDIKTGATKNDVRR